MLNPLPRKVTQKMAASNSAKIWAAIGASGTGKGLWIKAQLSKIKPKRLVVWDFMDEYGAHANPVRTLDELRRLMISAKGGPLLARYVPRGAGEKATRKEFEVFCELVYAWGKCVFIAEELSNVTTPGWAPAAWRKMTTSGRHAAVHIIGTTQTPALVDKTFLANCTLVHVSALRIQKHRDYVAENIDVDASRIKDLKPLEWIERDFDAGVLREGSVCIPK